MECKISGGRAELAICLLSAYPSDGRSGVVGEGLRSEKTVMKPPDAAKAHAPAAEKISLYLDLVTKCDPGSSAAYCLSYVHTYHELFARSGLQMLQK
jgi:hypothetical protein